MSEPSGYIVDIRSIIEDLGETIELDGEVELPVITVGSETFTPTGPAHVEINITNTGAGIVASGAVVVEVLTACVRCLREFPLSVTGQVEGFYVSHGDEYEIPEEQDIGFIAEGSVDLMEQILAALALELPFAPVHEETCPGICPACGADLTEGPCDCKPDFSDSPFAALKDLLPPEDAS